MHRIADGCGHRCHRAHDIAAGGQCRQQGSVDLGDRRLQAGFDDAVELDALPRRYPERAVGPVFGDFVKTKILLRGQPPAGNPHPDHELPYLAFAALFQFGRAVAVVALIDPVEFEQRVPLLVERGGGFRQVAGNVAAQLAALLLDRFGF